jgi:dTDP-4-amino-4,6-dideoxygalactose transaminase
LSALDLEKNSEVLIQAFTCVAVPNSIVWSGLQPVYVDIDTTLNIDTLDAKQKLTKKTRVLIVQHTFGIPADMDKIVAFCKTHDLILIEDCAHALGATYNGKLVGTFGDAAFFSFGRDKVVSSVFGGAAIIINKQFVQKVTQIHQTLAYPSFLWIGQQLFHPIITFSALALYNIFHVGKVLLWLSQKLLLVSFPVYREEKRAKKPAVFPTKYPNALATLLIRQLSKLEEFNSIRRRIAQNYFKTLSSLPFRLPEKSVGSMYLRFTVQTSQAAELRFRAKQKGIVLGNWYQNAIDPIGVNFEHISYREGSCPKAEKAAFESLNLPTYPTLSDKQTGGVIDFLTTYKY